MTKTWRTASVLLMMSVACASRATRTEPWHASTNVTSTSALIEEVDTYITREMTARRIPGLALAVADSNGVVIERAYGIANLETNTPVTTSSVFELASVTKPFTAACILMLVEQGKLGLDDSIPTYLPDAPQAWRGITIRHLLTHTSGLTPGAVPRYQGSPLLDISTRQAFDFIAHESLRSPPGAKWQYSDAGYFLLGMIIERVSGIAYREFVQRQIFDRLHMTESGILDRWQIVKNRVPVYTIRRGALAPWRRDWQYELPSFQGVRSTVEDVVKWDVAMRRADLLADSSLRQMWTPARLNNGFDAFPSYGLGWFLDEHRGHPIAEHSGASGAFVLHFLDRPLTVIVLTNLDVLSGTHAADLAHGIAALLKPDLRLPGMIAAETDASPALTLALSTLLHELLDGGEPNLMTPSHLAFFNSLSPEGREEFLALLRRVKSLTYLLTDTVSAPGLRITDPVTRIRYYRGETDGKPLYVKFFFTPGGKVAMIRVTMQ